jgi:hypothetical protein
MEKQPRFLGSFVMPSSLIDPFVVNETGIKMATASVIWCQEVRYGQGDTVIKPFLGRRRDCGSYYIFNTYLNWPYHS